MSFYNESFGNRILDLLNNYPIIERCPELGVLFDKCSTRELQELFPTIVNSIFGLPNGTLGWGLRTTCKENSYALHETLMQFFMPMGPMFRLCYRLLNDQIKFEFNLELLPRKLSEMLQSGHYPSFYADLLNIDPFRRTVSSLSLNAFDYYMLCFVIHGTFPMHKMHPAALQVHNERLKTVYFFLAADYLCTFLPTNLDCPVMPTNICATVKAPQPIPVPTMQPTRSPKYLKATPVMNYSVANQTNARISESPRSHAWRTESVLHFFIDVWLLFDLEETRDLPSSEFIRVVRILVKQTHSFVSAWDADTTSMSILRKLTQPMMKARIYPFLKSIISRWPLDSSLSVVLELWLSYIQPWRYSYTMERSIPHADIPIMSNHEVFILENLPIYTQIFLLILPRFERLDLTSLRNVIMLFRLTKVFNQTNLPQILRMAEQRFAASTFNLSTPQRQSLYNRSKANSTGEWESFRGDPIFHDETYTPLFSEAVQREVECFVKNILTSKMYIQQDMDVKRQEIAKRHKDDGWIKRMVASLFEEVSPAEIKLQEIRKIPEFLDAAANAFAHIIRIDLPNISMDQIDSHDFTQSRANFSLYEESDYLDISKISPTQMMKNISIMKPTIDPALYPIQSNECAVLVRTLHQISTKINEMYSDEILQLWQRTDIAGKLARQFLYPPMTSQWFDKIRGCNELCEEKLPPRICLRVFASYKTLGLILVALLVGQLFWGSPTYGLIILLFLTSVYTVVLGSLSS